MMGFFDNIAGFFSGQTAQDAANAQKTGLTQGYAQASDLLGQGRGALTTNYSAALQPFQANFNVAQGGQNAYADATGANGPEGGMRARAAFQADPGYQYRLTQGNENILRNASRTGAVNSGGTNIDLLNYGQGQANQGWQQYIQNLQPFLGQSNAAAGGIAGVNTNLGNQLAANFGQQGNAAYGTQAGIGNAQAQADLAKNAGVGNFLNLGMNLLKGGTGATGAGGLPSFNVGGFSPTYGYAEGGRPPVGQPSIVGERGPVYFIPDQPGTIVPNVASPRSRDSAILQDAAERLFGTSTLLANDTRRMMGQELTPAQRIVDSFLTVRGGTPLYAAQGDRFTPMGGDRNYASQLADFLRVP